MSEPTSAAGPDLTAGVPVASLKERVPFRGHVGGEPVILVKRGPSIFAIGATCPHYGGPLAEGLVVGDTIRCPWHHACFDIGHAPKWDSIEVRGNLAARDALVIFRQAGRPLAVVTVDRDRANLEAEAALERDGHAGLEAFLSAGC